MRTVALRDSNFERQPCLHASGDNRGRRPVSFEWQRLPLAPASIWRPREGERPHIWVTDSHLKEVEQWRGYGYRPVAWLLEPRELHPENYQHVIDHLGRFDAVVSHDRHFLGAVNDADGGEFGHPTRGYFAPSGGTRIHPSDWGIWEKSRAVSIVVSPKRSMEGHRLRHELIEALQEGGQLGDRPHEDRLHVYGYDGYLQRKRDALLPYRFSVAIENCRLDYWFTEALIDCFLTGTVPIYWGCPSIAEFFNPAGIIRCRDLDQLVESVQSVARDPDSYEISLPAIRDNFIRAHEYTLTEDWLFRQYPELFE